MYRPEKKEKKKKRKNEKDVPSSWEGGRGENPNSIFVGKYLIYFLPTWHKSWIKKKIK